MDHNAINELYFPLHPCFHSNKWALFSKYGQGVVDSVSYTTESYKLPCLQYKLLCMFTNNNN